MEICMCFCRYMFVIFKGNGCYKYGCGLLETLVQIQVFPNNLKERLMWNRFFNSYNLADTNIPLDLAVSSFIASFQQGVWTAFPKCNISGIRSNADALIGWFCSINTTMYYGNVIDIPYSLSFYSIPVLITNFMCGRGGSDAPLSLWFITKRTDSRQQQVVTCVCWVEWCFWHMLSKVFDSVRQKHHPTRSLST